MVCFQIVRFQIICSDAGDNRLRIDGQPSTGIAEPGEAIMVVGPNHQQGWNGSGPDNGGVGGCRGQKRLLGTPPWRKSRGDQFSTCAGAER